MKGRSRKVRWPENQESVILHPPDDEEGEGYACSVSEVRADRLAVTVAVERGERVPVSPGEKWMVRYFDESGEYRLPVEVLEVDPAPPTVVWLQPESQARRIQRRNAVRVNMRIPITVSLARPRPPALDPQRSRREAETGPWSGESLDISAGGLRLKLDSCLHADDRVELAIDLPAGPLRCTARVVRVVESGSDDGERERYYGLEFLDLDDDDRDRIMNVIFTEQRLRRQHGLT